MNYQTYNNYYYHKSKAVWWLHRRVDNEYFKKNGRYEDDAPSKLIRRIVEDLNEL